MASSWIKVEVITPDKPEIYQIAEILSIDPDAVLGKLIRIWAWADLQTLDGNAGSVTKSVLDRLTFVTGFADALIQVGWMREIDGKLILPNFDRHNGESSKKRALTNRRVAEHRKKKKKSVTHEALQNALPKALPEREEEEEYIKHTLSNKIAENFEFSRTEKFVVCSGWQPDADFLQKAAYWGTVLDTPVTQTELAEFIAYWCAEGKAKHHDQWQITLAKSLKYQRSKQRKGARHAQSAFKSDPAAGKSKAMQKFYQQVRETYGSEAVEALEADDRSLWREMDEQERDDAVIDVEASDKRLK
ncbi:DnaT-like ssDNA-binding domain-containing protein [Arsenophonus nasoniae]|uniref:DnaT-like ssDNA-binding domain-containing protein n=1 Tax=Arsenophonus nasoniae TaxID=638 RepID=A0AA95GHI3_9GAMM|nr:DnaT-like ssDNA-binding domain-containing protein [Arsenophonus nasoniae]WGL96473.1 DnaT-like ssDNA-binding domain-containing protein [Arsenophonus nasoniae]